MVSLIQTTIGTILGPLVGQLDAQRQTIERQADQLVMQAETIGTLRADLAVARAENAALAARTAAQVSPEPSTPLRSLWARWWPLVAVLVALVAAGVLLAWPR